MRASVSAQQIKARAKLAKWKSDREASGSLWSRPPPDFSLHWHVQSSATATHQKMSSVHEREQHIKASAVGGRNDDRIGFCTSKLIHVEKFEIQKQTHLVKDSCNLHCKPYLVYPEGDKY